jgi:hypothetical protein
MFIAGDATAVVIELRTGPIETKAQRVNREGRQRERVSWMAHGGRPIGARPSICSVCSPRWGATILARNPSRLGTHEAGGASFAFFHGHQSVENRKLRPLLSLSFCALISTGGEFLQSRPVQAFRTVHSSFGP